MVPVVSAVHTCEGGSRASGAPAPRDMALLGRGRKPEGERLGGGPGGHGPGELPQ